MSARRQPSATSLAKYARTASPDTTARNFDFCNAFWGIGDGGVDVLFARMRGAARTMEELRTFWKERCVALPPLILFLSMLVFLPRHWSLTRVAWHRSSIEEDYAKRMAKLAKMPIGRDEIGYVPFHPAHTPRPFALITLTSPLAKSATRSTRSDSRQTNKLGSTPSSLSRSARISKAK